MGCVRDIVNFLMQLKKKINFMKLHHYYWLFIITILSGSYLKGELANGLIFVGMVSLIVLIAIVLVSYLEGDLPKRK